MYGRLNYKLISENYFRNNLPYNKQTRTMENTVTNLLQCHKAMTKTALYTLHGSMKDSQTTESQENPVRFCVITFIICHFLDRVLQTYVRMYFSQTCQWTLHTSPAFVAENILSRHQQYSKKNKFYCN
jgi:hypothetical protein